MKKFGINYKFILMILTLTMMVSLPVSANENIEKKLEEAYNMAVDGKEDEAIKAYEELYDIMKESTQDEKKRYNTIYSNLGMMYTDAGEYYKAITLLEQAVPLYAGETWLPNVYKNLAKSYYGIGEYNKAIEYANLGLECGSNQWLASLYEIKADSLKACERYDEAIEHYEQMYKHNENELYYYDKLAKCNEAAENYDKAVGYYFNIAENEKYAEGYTQNAVNALILKDEEALENIIQKHLVDKWGYGNWEIACFLYNFKHYDKSLPYFEAAIDEAENDIERIYWYASALYAAGKYEKALEYFQKVADIDETFNSTNLFLIYCNTELGNYEKSNELCKEILVDDPENMSALSSLRWNNVYMGKRDEAVTAIENSVLEKKADVRVSSNYIDTKKDITMDEIHTIYSNLDGWPADSEKEQAFFIIDKISMGHFTENSQKEFAGYLEKMNDAYSGNYKIVSSLADCYMDMGEYEKAMKFYERAKRLNPYETEAILKKQITILEYIGEYEQALEVSNQAIQTFPESDYFKLEKALILVKYMNSQEEAIAIAESILTDEEDNSNALEILVLAYDSMEEYERALIYADKYLEEYPDSIIMKAYKAKTLNTLGKEGADELIAEIEKEPYSTCSTSLIFANALLGNTDKVKEYLLVYLTEHPYMDNAKYFADNYYMKEALLDSEIQDILGVEVSAGNAGGFLGTSKLPIAGIAVTVTGLILMICGIVINKKQKK